MLKLSGLTLSADIVMIKRNERDSLQKYIPALQLTGIGFYIALCIGGGAYAGWKLGHGNKGILLAGLVIGMILAGLGAYRLIKPFLRKTGQGE